MKHSLKEQVKGSLIRPLRSRVATGLSPTFKIPLIDSVSSVPSGLVSTFTRNSSATYIDANGVLQTAAIDVPRFQNGRYLVEPAATNIFLQSGTPATQIITVVSGSVYIVQCFGAGNITLSGAGTGTVVQGTPITFTASSTSLICTVTGSLSRAQVELGPKATSYIKTTSSGVTRAADALHYDVSSVITQGQGSLYCEFKYGYTSAYPRIFELTDNTAASNIMIRITNFRLLGAVVTSSSTNQATINTSSAISDDTLYKICVTYKNDEVKFYANGVLIGSDFLTTIPINVSKLSVGCTRTGSYQLNGEIGNIKYYKEVLTEAEAIKLTTL